MEVSESSSEDEEPKGESAEQKAKKLIYENWDVLNGTSMKFDLLGLWSQTSHAKELQMLWAEKGIDVNEEAEISAEEDDGVDIFAKEESDEDSEEPEAKKEEEEDSDPVSEKSSDEGDFFADIPTDVSDHLDPACDCQNCVEYFANVAAEEDKQKSEETDEANNETEGGKVERLNVKILDHVAHQVGGEWKRLGRYLGMEEEILKEIDNSNDKVWEKSVRCLRSWRNKHCEHPSWKELKLCLYDLESIGLIEEVEEEFGEYIEKDENLESVEETLNGKVLEYVGKQVGDRWKVLGRLMKLDNYILDDIDEDYTKGHQKATKCLRIWRIIEGRNANWGVVRRFLWGNQLQLRDIVDDVEETFAEFIPRDSELDIVDAALHGKILVYVAEQTSGDWMRLGNLLEVEESAVEEIDHPEMDTAFEKSLKCLRTWRKEKGVKATWKRLAPSLMEIELQSVTKHVEKELKQYISTAEEETGPAETDKYDDDSDTAEYETVSGESDNNEAVRENTVKKNTRATLKKVQCNRSVTPTLLADEINYIEEKDDDFMKHFYTKVVSSCPSSTDECEDPNDTFDLPTFQIPSVDMSVISNRNKVKDEKKQQQQQQQQHTQTKSTRRERSAVEGHKFAKPQKVGNAGNFMVYKQSNWRSFELDLNVYNYDKYPQHMTSGETKDQKDHRIHTVAKTTFRKETVKSKCREERHRDGSPMKEKKARSRKVRRYKKRRCRNEVYKKLHKETGDTSHLDDDSPDEEIPSYKTLKKYIGDRDAIIATIVDNLLITTCNVIEDIEIAKGKCTGISKQTKGERYQQIEQAKGKKEQRGQWAYKLIKETEERRQADTVSYCIESLLDNWEEHMYESKKERTDNQIEDIAENLVTVAIDNIVEEDVYATLITRQALGNSLEALGMKRTGILHHFKILFGAYMLEPYIFLTREQEQRNRQKVLHQRKVLNNRLVDRKTNLTTMTDLYGDDVKTLGNEKNKKITTPRDKKITTPRDKKITTPRDKKITTPRDKEKELEIELKDASDIDDMKVGSKNIEDNTCSSLVRDEAIENGEDNSKDKTDNFRYEVDQQPLFFSSENSEGSSSAAILIAPAVRQLDGDEVDEILIKSQKRTKVLNEWTHNLKNVIESTRERNADINQEETTELLYNTESESDAEIGTSMFINMPNLKDEVEKVLQSNSEDTIDEKERKTSKMQKKRRSKRRKKETQYENGSTFLEPSTFETSQTTQQLISSIPQFDRDEFLEDWLQNGLPTCSQKGKRPSPPLVDREQRNRKFHLKRPDTSLSAFSDIDVVPIDRTLYEGIVKRGQLKSANSLGRPDTATTFCESTPSSNGRKTGSEESSAENDQMNGSSASQNQPKVKYKFQRPVQKEKPKRDMKEAWIYYEQHKKKTESNSNTEIDPVVIYDIMDRHSYLLTGIKFDERKLDEEVRRIQFSKNNAFPDASEKSNGDGKEILLPPETPWDMVNSGPATPDSIDTDVEMNKIRDKFWNPRLAESEEIRKKAGAVRKWKSYVKESKDGEQALVPQNNWQSAAAAKGYTKFDTKYIANLNRKLFNKLEIVARNDKHQKLSRRSTKSTENTPPHSGRRTTHKEKRNKSTELLPRIERNTKLPPMEKGYKASAIPTSPPTTKPRKVAEKRRRHKLEPLQITQKVRPEKDPTKITVILPTR